MSVPRKAIIKLPYRHMYSVASCTVPKTIKVWRKSTWQIPGDGTMRALRLFVPKGTLTVSGVFQSIRFPIEIVSISTKNVEIKAMLTVGDDLYL